MTEPTDEQPQPKKPGNKPGSNPSGLWAGQQTLLTEQITQRLCAALAGNQTMRAACGIAKVHPRTVRDWMTKGEAGQEPYAEFYERVMEARAVGEIKLVKTLNDSAEAGDTKSAQFLLERRHREDWGRVDRVEHSGAVDNKMVIELVWPNGASVDPDSALELPAPANVIDAEVIEDQADGNEDS